jgi:hypothetical protein
MAGRFLNVDLEIESSADLSVLVRDLGDSVMVLHHGPGKRAKNFLCLESSRSQRNADAAIRALATALSRLSEPGRHAWNMAEHKVFDIGYEVEPNHPPTTVQLRQETLAQIVKLGATLAITWYHPAPAS